MRRKKPKRKRISTYVAPPDHSARQWRRSLAMLFLGLLLPTLWSVYRYWAPGASSVQSALLTMVRAPYALGFVHAVALPLFALLAIGAMALLGKRLFNVETSAACTSVAVIGMISLCVTGALMLWTYAYVPLVDQLWVEFGGTVGHYRHFSLPGRSSKASATPYANGETTAIALWVVILISASVSGKQSKT